MWTEKEEESEVLSRAQVVLSLPTGKSERRVFFKDLCIYLKVRIAMGGGGRKEIE